MRSKNDKNSESRSETVKGRKILEVFRPEELPPEMQEPTDLPDFEGSQPPRQDEPASSLSSEDVQPSSEGPGSKDGS